MTWYGPRGKHAFKFGTLLNRYNQGSQDTNSFNGQLQYNQFPLFLQGVPAIVEFAPTFADEKPVFHLPYFWLLRARMTGGPHNG